jgi:LacI family transcriptional regulator
VTTLRDIARELGVHPSTVSRAIVDKPGVSDAKRKLVLDTAAKLHYKPNALARGLRSGQHHVVGLVFPDVLNELYNTTATILARKLTEQGYLTHLFLTYDQKSAEREALLSLAEHQVSGIVIAPCGPRDATASKMLSSIPIVEFMRGTRARADKVLWHDEEAAYAATSHLLGLGHRSIRFITGVPYVRTTIARVAGFGRAIREAGLDQRAGSVRFGLGESDWRAAAREYAADYPGCTAVLASNHLIALQILASLAEFGLSMPDDVSLVGLDDPSWFWAVGGGITAVTMPWEEMAETTADLLLARMANGAAAKPRWRPTTRTFPARLVVRSSTASPAQRM